MQTLSQREAQAISDSIYLFVTTLNKSLSMSEIFVLGRKTGTVFHVAKMLSPGFKSCIEFHDSYLRGESRVFFFHMTKMFSLVEKTVIVFMLPSYKGRLPLPRANIFLANSETYAIFYQVGKCYQACV